MSKESKKPAESNETFGGEVIGRTLKEAGVEATFGIYGSIGLAIEAASQRGVKMYHFRHEQSAGFAADAYARCLKKPGICFSSSAPGFTNLVSPIAQAQSALSPVVLLNGQHGTTGDGVNTIQEGYAADVLKPFSKWTHRCLDWNMHAYWTKKALTESVQYPPGPVVLEFPRNALNAKGPDRQLKYEPAAKTPSPSLPFGDPQEIERVVAMLRDAKRPLLIAGDGVYWSDGMKALKDVAEQLAIPVHTRRTARGAVAENHSLAFTGGYRGALFRNADVICLIGMRASYLEEWFEPPEWRRDVRYIQIAECANEVWPGLPTEIAVVGAAGPVLSQMLTVAKALSPTPPAREEWLNTLGAAREKFKLRQGEAVDSWRARKGELIHPHVLGASIADVLDDQSTVIFDSFTATSFLTDKLESKYASQILDAGLHQPVGHGIGMAVGAQIARPGRQVLALMGDGGFGISAMDMETLLRYNLPAVIVLMNNNSWSTVAAGHDEFYPEMGSWDNTHDIRYDRMFKELGCHTEHCVEPDEITPALDRAFASGKPSLVHVVADTRDIHPLRLRICWGDAWSRGDLDRLPPAAKEVLKRNASARTLRRVQKYWVDNGIDIPLEDLARMADFPLDKLDDDKA
ncbi:thiamine pyrophosphate-binding protein [Marinicaulis aureus]|uniref:Thiamine pyrophosphate-binding protein n=1 Tax=Hyphococcus aureus TaxID=2666033 RepID=A0ABW1KYS4_9PROT